MRRLYIKRKTVKENIYKSINTECIGKCLPYFCFIFWTIMGIGLLIAIFSAFVSVEEIYETRDKNEIGGSDAFVYFEWGKTGFCRATQQYQTYEMTDTDQENNFGYTQLPTSLGSYAQDKNCVVNDYRLWTVCRMLYDESDGGNNHQLNCTLNYYYQGQNQEDCTHLPENTTCNNFNVKLGECGDYTIPCDKWQGNASFYLCFDYCYYDSDL